MLLNFLEDGADGMREIKLALGIELAVFASKNAAIQPCGDRLYAGAP
jgi:hypothetical protein